MGILTGGQHQQIAKFSGGAVSPFLLGDKFGNGQRLSVAIGGRAGEGCALHQGQVGPIVSHGRGLMPAKTQQA
jgi:hypothetical protein